MYRLAGGVMLLWGVRRAVLAFMAGAIGALALPPVNFFGALFVSFTLLVWLLDGATGNPDSGYSRGLRASFLTGWFFGFGYFVAGLWWLGNALLVEADDFAWALPIAILGLPAVLALFYGLAAMLAKLLWSDGVGRIAALAAGFGIAEWLRSVVATGFPWNAIGYGAMPVPLMMQSVHVVGLFGVTTLAVFVFSAPALIGTRKGMAAGLAIAGVLLGAHLGYGAYRLSAAPDAADARELTVRLVQPAVDQARKLANSDREEIFAGLLALSGLPPQPGGKRPDVIVWPETSVPFILTENPDAFTRIADRLESGQVLLAGAVRSEDGGAGHAPRYYNSVYMLGDDGQVLAASDKVHLTPFGEYVPFEGLLRRIDIENLVNLPGGFSAAPDRTMLTLPNGAALYPLICYEVIFPDEMRPGSEKADAVLNLTNDAWFGMTPGPYQHLQQARIRAVENAVPVIRAANSGISAVVDARGRIVSGLALAKNGVVDATVSLLPVSKWSNGARFRNFWLIVAVAISVAAFSRRGFGMTMN